MLESRGAVSIFDLDDAMRNTIRGMPHRLIREDKAPPEIQALGRLVPPSADLAELGPIVGMCRGGPARPDVVVTGVCQGRARVADKLCWLKMGPTVESICILDSAYRIASAYGCRLEIWVPDQEYAYTVVDPRFDSRPDTEVHVGTELESWCRSRYPGAAVQRTSNPDVRADLYSVVTEVQLAQLYPTGVWRPYNSSGSVFWQELQFLATVALFYRPARQRGERVWAVADHEQLRPMAAACALAPDLVKTISLWPCPRLRWAPPARREEEASARYAERFLARIKKGNRRMFRGASPKDMLFINMKPSDIAEWLSAPGDEPIWADTLLEILRYLGVATTEGRFRTVGDAVDALYAGLERLRWIGRDIATANNGAPPTFRGRRVTSGGAEPRV